MNEAYDSDLPSVDVDVSDPNVATEWGKVILEKRLATPDGILLTGFGLLPMRMNSGLRECVPS